MIDHLRRLDRISPARALPQRAEHIDRLAGSLCSSIGHRLSLAGEHVRRHAERLSAMGYKSVLGRGFSITRAKKGRQVLRTTRGLKDRQRVMTELADGEFESEIVNLTQLELFE